MLNGLKDRGVQDILIASADGLPGFVEAIIHQIRSSTRYVSYKDIKQFTADLKPVYKAPTEETSPYEFEAKCGGKYPPAVKFRAEHESELAAREAAKRAFDALHAEKLPSMTQLKSEYGKLLEQKKRQYEENRNLKSEQYELQTALRNVDRILLNPTVHTHKEKNGNNR